MFTYSFSSSKFTFKSNPNKELPTENNMKLTLTTQCYLNYIFLYLQFTITNKHFFVISRSAFRRKPCADMRQKRHLCKLCPGRSSSDFVNNLSLMARGSSGHAESSKIVDENCAKKCLCRSSTCDCRRTMRWNRCRWTPRWRTTTTPRRSPTSSRIRPL